MKERRSFLLLTLTCPRCSRELEIANLTDFEQFRAFPICGDRKCRQRWWAMILAPGDVQPQIAAVVGEELAPVLMEAWKLPASVRQQTFWQLSITTAQYEQHGRAGSRALLRFLTSILTSLVPSKASA
jgi:hypothetical protein